MMRTILLIKMDHLGDALWSFPAIRALAGAYPGATIDMLCTPYLSHAFRRLPYLGDVIEYDAGWTFSARWGQIRRLRDKGYDAAINLGPVDKVNHLAFLSGAATRIGYAYKGNPIHALTGSFFLTQRLPHPSDVAQAAGEPLPHEVTALCGLISRLPKVEVRDTGLFLPFTESEDEFALEWCRQNLQAREQAAAVQLCAKAFPHGWKGEAFVQLLTELRKLRPEIQLIVTAGPTETPYLKEYHPALEKLGIPLVCDFSFGRMAALLSRMSFLVSWDTGVVHMATAVNTPVVDVFPSQNFIYCVQRWGPWGKHLQVLSQTEAVLTKQTMGQISAAVLSIPCRKWRGIPS